MADAEKQFGGDDSLTKAQHVVLGTVFHRAVVYAREILGHNSTRYHEQLFLPVGTSPDTPTRESSSDFVGAKVAPSTAVGGRCLLPTSAPAIAKEEKVAGSSMRNEQEARCTLQTVM